MRFDDDATTIFSSLLRSISQFQVLLARGGGRSRINIIDT
jgi:hypothetical protein